MKNLKYIDHLAIAISALIKDPKGRYFHKRGLFLYIASNEEPKYKIARLKQARRDFSNAIKLKSTLQPNSYYLGAMTNYQLDNNSKDLICDDLFKAEQLGIKNDFSKSFCE